MKLLSESEVKKQLADLKNWIWNRERVCIEKNFQFSSFTDAIIFLNKIAELAEELDHHPDLHLTKYRNLKVVLSTHSAGGLTQRDFKMAAHIEESYGEA